MNPDQFIRKYEDTHTELQVLEAMQKNKSLIKVHPEDKNIQLKKEIPGKHLIEAIETEKRAEGLQHVLLDACAARLPDLMEMPMEKLLSATIKMIPQKIDAKVDANFSLVNLIQRAHTVDVDE